MGVRRESKHDLAEAMRERYWAAGRQKRRDLLDEFVAVSGYHRKYAITVLRHGTKADGSVQHRGDRAVTYGPPVLAALQVAQEAAGWICGKRLAPFLEELVPALEREGELSLTAGVRESLLRISASTIDRRLATARRRAKPRGLGTTKPGSLLKQQVPIRTFTPLAWNSPQVLPAPSPLGVAIHCINDNND